VIVLDASVLIGHLEPADVRHDRATELLLQSAAIPFASSVVSLAEIYVGAERAGRLADAQRAVSLLGVTPLPLPADIGPRLAQLRVATSLKLPDCCVLEAAERHGATLATFDGALAAHARRLGLTVG
jgi:toxin FitB